LAHIERSEYVASYLESVNAPAVSAQRTLTTMAVPEVPHATTPQ
jgi:hypothetical protein